MKVINTRSTRLLRFTTAALISTDGH